MMDYTTEYPCPNCGETVWFTEEQVEEDGNHLEEICPHCGALCCFICEYVYESKLTTEEVADYLRKWTSREGL